ncbi:peptidoglycan-binding protein [uncultured Tateyamaria sp.]|uniref:NlpC/P60 family protein n=1 Tax=Tateyamaria sp. 1078 TaxID=3417464 RepID=UPI00262A49E5|nr:peptidoglycan-binding protein [uncultured Tateyamaria sp.]
MDIDWIMVQHQLARLGFYGGAIDGLRGPLTDAAIVDFKRSIGLRARPYLGPLTYDALFGAKSAIDGRSTLPWMLEAAHVRGLHEARDLGVLRAWFDRSVAWIDPREIPWCGAFVATAFRQWQHDIDLPENPLGARNWMKFGRACPPQFGAVLVFWRGSKKGWKGHVGFYHAEDNTHFHVLGGNQSNAVTVSRIAKTRFLQARWPLGHQTSDRRFHADTVGIRTTVNEV